MACLPWTRSHAAAPSCQVTALNAGTRILNYLIPRGVSRQRNSHGYYFVLNNSLNTFHYALNLIKFDLPGRLPPPLHQ